MKLALFQMKIKWEDKKENLRHLEVKLRELHGRQIELLLLPEMSFTGFSMNTEVTKEKENETVTYMRKLAKKYNIGLGFGWVKDCCEKSENHYTIIDCLGNIVSDYTKIHPFSYSGEDKKFQGGKEIVVFPWSDMFFSMFICYDLRFPEIFQIVSKRVDAIIIPANWPQKRSEHWKTLLKARAIENQVYIFAVNCYGNIGGQYYSGESCIINPDGKIIDMVSDEEAILEYEFVNDVNVYRENFPVKLDRQNKLYYEMIKKSLISVN